MSSIQYQDNATMQQTAPLDSAFFVGGWGGVNSYPLSGWWTPVRDAELRAYVRQNPFLSAIVYQRAKDLANLEWAIVAEDKAVEPLIPYYTSLFQECQFGEGLGAFIDRWVQDYHTQDNGAFVELIGSGVPVMQTVLTGEYQTPTTAYFMPPQEKRDILSFALMDSGNAMRTSNRYYPVCYSSPWNRERVFLHKSRIYAMAQMPSPFELARGVGFSAASRAFEALEIAKVSNTYVYEKMTGQAPELAIVQGIPVAAIKQAVEDGAIELDNKGRVRYKGIQFLQGNVTGGTPPSITLAELHNVPDGWDREKELTLAMYIIAMAFGTDVRDVGWAMRSTGSTKADAEVQDMKTVGKGRLDALVTLERFFTTRILPDGLRFQFDAANSLEAQRKADLLKMRTEARLGMLEAGAITLEEFRELAATDGDLPSEWTRAVGGGNTTLQQKSVNTYNQTLTTIAKQYVNGVMNKWDFKRAMKAEIARQFKLAWQAGLRELGGETEMGSGAQADELQRLIAEENQYVQEFVNAVEERHKALGLVPEINNRLSIWANAFNRIRNTALLYLGGNKLMQWQYGDTEHCSDCLALNGTIKTAKEWAVYPMKPQGRELACGGWNCQCRLVVVSNKALDLTPPQGAREAAQRALAWRDEFGRGGTAVGIARARDISNGKNLSPDTINRMVSFFARHEVDKQATGFNSGEEGFPSNGRIAWDLWGGDAGKTWAERMAERLDNEDA